MTNFKVGDKVVINPEHAGVFPKGTDIDLVRTVESIHRCAYIVVEGVKYSWCSYRFLHAPTEPIPEFDITADISRQYLRNGKKVMAIVDNGLDCVYPLAVWYFDSEGVLSEVIAVTSRGKSRYVGGYWDIVTRPVEKPLEVSYTVLTMCSIQVFSDAANLPTLQKEKTIKDIENYAPSVIHKIIETTYNPNTEKYSYRYFNSLAELKAA